MSTAVLASVSKSVEIPTVGDAYVAYDVDLVVTAKVTYCPAKVSGPPEQCHPDESEITDRKIEILCVYDEYGQIVPCSPELELKILSTLDSEDLDCDIWEAFHVGD